MDIGKGIDADTALHAQAPDPPGARSRSGSGQLAAHGLVLLLILLSLVPLIDNGYLAIPDEGVYTAQADNIARGAWAQERPTADIDRHGDWFVVTGSTIVGDKAIPYARRPLYPTMLAPFFGRFGVGGGLVLSVLGTWVAACATAGVAAVLDRRAVLPTLWLVGLGTPLLFDAYLIVGHSWGAAFIALCAFGVAGAVQQDAATVPRRLVWIGIAVLSASLATLVRSEGVIAVLAIGVSLVITGVLGRRQQTPHRLQQFGLGVGLGAVGIGSYLLNDFWAKSVAAGAAGDPTVSDRMPDFLGAMWTGLWRPWYPDNTAANAAMTIVLLAAVAAPLILRWCPRFRLFAFGLLGLAAVAAAYKALADPELISGFLPATPWAVIGILSLRRTDVAKPVNAVLALSGAIATVAILATSYGFGGAIEWGGRFFHILVPLVAPLGVVGILTLLAGLAKREGSVVVGLVLFLTVAMSITAVRVASDLRSETEDAIANIKQASDSVGNTIPITFVSVTGNGVPRLMWPLNQQGRTVLTTDGLVNLPLLLHDLPKGTDQILAVTYIDSAAAFAPILDGIRGQHWSVRSVPGSSDGPSFFLLTRGRSN